MMANLKQDGTTIGWDAILPWLRPDALVADWIEFSEKHGDLETTKRVLGTMGGDRVATHALERILEAERRVTAYQGVVEFLPNEPQDEEICILAFNRWLTEIAKTHPIQEVRATRIDNWFGEKWCLFSGKVLGALTVHSGVPRVPPFHPNRVEATLRYQRDGDAGFTLVPVERALERFQASSDAVNRKVKDEFEHCALAWFSSQSKVNGRCSIMIYAPTGNEEKRKKGVPWHESDQTWWPFYVELVLSESGRWHVERMLGIGARQIEGLGGLVEFN